MNPLISVIIPVFNTSVAVRRLLALLLNQTYENLEIICVDDGSTDDSFKQMKALAKTDDRLKVFSQKNAGASSARNLGLKHATGEYIAFIDSDDLITHDYFDLMYNGIKRGKRAFSVCGFHYFRLNSHSQNDVFINPFPAQKPGEPARAYLLRFMAEDGRLYSSVNKLFRAEIIKKYQISFDESKNFAEDTKFVFDYLDAWLREGKTEKVQIGPVLKPLYIYNFGTETSTVKKSSLIWQNWLDSYADFEDFAYARNAAESTSTEKTSPSAPLSKPLAKKRLRLLKRRFEISHALAVARAPIPKSKKLKYLKSWQLFLANIAVRFRP